MAERVSSKALIQVAWTLIGQIEGQPADVADALIRRAVSTAYYALFHEIRFLIATRLVPPDVSHVRGELGVRAYRTLDHQRAVDTARRIVNGAAQAGSGRSADEDTQPFAPEELVRFCDVFLTLHRARQHADYNPSAQLGRFDAEILIQQAERVLELWSSPNLAIHADRFVAELLARLPKQDSK